jgi:hypothetical protein
MIPSGFGFKGGVSGDFTRSRMDTPTRHEGAFLKVYGGDYWE